MQPLCIYVFVECQHGNVNLNNYVWMDSSLRPLWQQCIMPTKQFVLTRKMATVHLLGLMLVCWYVGEICSQTFPYVSFMGQTIANHSFVLVGSSGSDGVQ